MLTLLCTWKARQIIYMEVWIMYASMYVCMSVCMTLITIAEGRKLYEISVVVNATGTAESSLFYSWTACKQELQHWLLLGCIQIKSVTCAFWINIHLICVYNYLSLFIYKVVSIYFPIKVCVRIRGGSVDYECKHVYVCMCMYYGVWSTQHKYECMQHMFPVIWTLHLCMVYAIHMKLTKSDIEGDYVTVQKELLSCITSNHPQKNVCSCRVERGEAPFLWLHEVYIAYLGVQSLIL